MMTDDEGSLMRNSGATGGESDLLPSDVAEGMGSLEIAELVRLYHGLVYRYAYRLTLSVADAEDLTQQTFLVAQQKIDQIREPDKVDRWLLAVLRSRFLKECRKRVPTPMPNLETEVFETPNELFPEEQDEKERLDQALRELPEPFRLVLTMHYFEDLSYKEIACQLEIPIGTVMSRLARAKKHLRRRMVGQQASTR